MPYHEPDPTDPLSLNGVQTPGEESSPREMAEVFIDEFFRQGFGREQILNLFRNPFYRSPHALFRLLGEEQIVAILQETALFWEKVQQAGKQANRAPLLPLGALG